MFFFIIIIIIIIIINNNIILMKIQPQILSLLWCKIITLFICLFVYFILWICPWHPIMMSS